MADINQIITLGIGTPSDIEHFTLVGLNASSVVPPVGQPVPGTRNRRRHRGRTIYVILFLILMGL
jgi:hypothetical protein